MASSARASTSLHQLLDLLHQVKLDEGARVKLQRCAVWAGRRGGLPEHLRQEVGDGVLGLIGGLGLPVSARLRGLSLGASPVAIL